MMYKKGGTTKKKVKKKKLAAMYGDPKKITRGDIITAAKEKEEEKIMAKLCARGKAAAKRKFDVYPSAYANMYASAVCSGKVTPGGKKKKKKMAGGGEVLDFNKISQDRKRVSSYAQGGIAKGCGAIMQKKRKKTKKS